MASRSATAIKTKKARKMAVKEAVENRLLESCADYQTGRWVPSISNYSTADEIKRYMDYLEWKNANNLSIAEQILMNHIRKGV